MIPTPRTDACTFHLALCNNDLPTDAVCPAEKMAELERENIRLRVALETMLSRFDDKSWNLRVQREIEAARSALEPAQPPAQKQ